MKQRLISERRTTSALLPLIFAIPAFVVGIALALSDIEFYSVAASHYVAGRGVVTILTPSGTSVADFLLFFLGAGSLVLLSCASFIFYGYLGKSSSRRVLKARNFGITFTCCAIAAIFLASGIVVPVANATISSSPSAIVSAYSCDKGQSFLIAVDNAVPPNYYAIATSGTATTPCGTLVYGGPNNAGGATGTNASAVIEAAMNGVPPLVSGGYGGGIVSVACGIYYIPHTIKVTTRVDIIGSGRNCTLFAPQTGVSNLVMFNYAPASAKFIFRMESLKIFNNNTAYTGTAVSFPYTNSYVNEFMFFDTEVRDFSTGINGTIGGGYAYITDCDILSAVTLEAPSIEPFGLSVNNNYITGTNVEFEAEQLTFDGNVVGGAEIKYEGYAGTTDATFSGNTWQGSLGTTTPWLYILGVSVAYTTSAIAITGNTFQDLGSAGTHHWIIVGNNIPNVNIQGNNFIAKTANDNIQVGTGDTGLAIRDNVGYNGVGLCASNCLIGGTSSVTVHTIGPYNGNSTTLVASQTYTIAYTDTNICFTAVGSASLSINGGTRFTPALACYFLSVGTTVNFGAFGGSPPTIQVDFN